MHTPKNYIFSFFLNILIITLTSSTFNIMTNIPYTLIYNDEITLNISDGAFRLYMLLQSMCYGDKDNCFPSQKYLAEKLKKSIRTVQRYLNELMEASLITKKRRGSISNLYTLMQKRIKEKMDKAIDKAKNSYNSIKSHTKRISAFSLCPERNYDYKILEEQLLGYEPYDPSKFYRR